MFMMKRTINNPKTVRAGSCPECFSTCENHWCVRFNREITPYKIVGSISIVKIVDGTDGFWSNKVHFKALILFQTSTEIQHTIRFRNCTECMVLQIDNGNTQQCNIFRHKEYNLYLVVCDVSTLHMLNIHIEFWMCEEWRGRSNRS